MISTATRPKLVKAALSLLRAPGPVNTCVSNGMQRIARMAGAPKLTNPNGVPTASITEARRDAAAKRDGWRYHDGLDGIQPGDFADWAAPLFHVSCVIAVDRSGGKVARLRTIGSGGPTGLVNWQPAAGDVPGWNPAARFRGYWTPPLAAAAKAPAKAPSKAPAKAAKPTVHTVAKGEVLSVIARKYGVPWQAIAQANHLANPNRLSIGQRLTIPAK